MKEFIAFWKNYVNFSDRTTRRGYWMAFLFIILATIVVAIVSVIGDSVGLFPVVFRLTLEGNLEVVYNALDVAWYLVLIIPGLAMAVRRLRDAGKKWTWIFINLILIVGTIWYIVLLCKSSVEDDGTPVV